MLRRFFSYDNPVWRAVNRVGQIWLLDILWLLCSLPIITLGASTTALIYSCMKLREDDGYAHRNFFHSFKENFAQSTLLLLIYGAVGALLAFSLVFWNQTDPSSIKLGWAVVIALSIPYFLSLLYVFACQAKFVNTVKNTIHYSIILSIKHFKYTIQMVLVMVFVVYFNLTTVFFVNYVTLFFGVGLVAYLFSIYYASIFQHYIHPQEESEEESAEEPSLEESSSEKSSLEESFSEESSLEESSSEEFSQEEE